MVGREILERKIDELETLAIEIEIEARKLFNEAPISYQINSYGARRYFWMQLPEEMKNLQRDAIRKYQSWYISTYQLVKEYIPEKLKEFAEGYNGRVNNGIFVSLKLKNLPESENRIAIINKNLDSFETQRSILLSIPLVVEVKELSLMKIIASDFIDSELDQAELLFKNGFERAAGAVAGVALEKHLKTLCEISGVTYKHKDTIEPLAQALYSAGKIEHTELKKIIYLGGIRNDCAHPNDVKEDHVRALIEQVKKIVS